jgi:hypothetical protein
LLLLGVPDSSVNEISIPVGMPESDYQVITAAVVICLFPEYIETQLIVEKSPAPLTQSIKMQVTGLLDGPCRISLGRPENSAGQLAAGQPAAGSAGVRSESRGFIPNTGNAAGGSGPYEQFRSLSVNGRNAPINAVWDQLAIFYITPPEPNQPEIVSSDEDAPVIAAPVQAGIEQPEIKTEGVSDNPEPIEHEDTESVTDHNETEHSEIYVSFIINETLPVDLEN